MNIVQKSDLYKLIKEGESQTLDFKKSVPNPHKIARTLTAFANTDGGKILIGIDDDGTLIGIDPEEEKYVISRSAEQFCVPPVDFLFEEIEEDTHTVLLVSVLESNQKPHLAVDEHGVKHHYKRVQDRNIVQI